MATKHKDSREAVCGVNSGGDHKKDATLSQAARDSHAVPGDSQAMRQDRGVVRDCVKESVKRSSKENADVWEKLSKY